MKENEILQIYLCSPGGSLDDCFVTIDMINQYKDNIVLKAFGEISSAAFIIYFQVKCKKYIMDYTIGMVHYAYMSVPSNQGGDVVPDGLDTFSYNELVKYKDEFINFYKALGFNKRELDFLKKGKDVHFSTERLRELQACQQKQKK